MNRSRVVVTVLGDKGVGKTSLITTAAQDCFSENPPPVVPPTRFPTDFSADAVELLVYDTSSKPEDHQAVEHTLKLADVIVLCCDAQQRDTVMRLRTYWLPEIQRLNPDTPVILACCKADSDDAKEIEDIRDSLQSLLNEFPSLEVCLKCSASRLKQVQDVFFYCLKVVLYPMGPLFDKSTQALTPLCVKALMRIFTMCDFDNDDALNDEELNNFQVLCFNTPLQPEELRSVKDVVRSKMLSGIDERGLLFQGFLYLHSLFITRGRLESTWTVMRKFGYNEQLQLADEVLDRVNFNVPVDVVLELSDVALGLLEDKFERHDADMSGLLKMQDLDRMFLTAPAPAYQHDAWLRVQVAGTYNGALTKEGFLCKWRYLTLQAPRTALEQLLYLGLGGPRGVNPQALLTRAPRKRPDKRHEGAHRSTVSCLLFGSKGCGKSALAKALAGHRHDEPLPRDLVSAGNVPHHGTLKTLVITEVSVEAQAELRAGPAAQRSSAPSVVHSSDTAISGAAVQRGSSPAGTSPKAGSLLSELTRCDVAAFAFDSSSAASFNEAVELLVAVSTAAGDALPCLLIAAKDDLGMSPELQAACTAKVCELRLAGLQAVSVVTGELNGVFSQLVDAALRPEGHIPDTPLRRARRNTVRRVALYAGVAVAGSLAIYGLWRLGRSYIEPSSTRSSLSSPSATSHRPVAGQGHRVTR